MSTTFLTGAGISTGAGIPDFRGPQGVWTQDPDAEKMSTLSWYLRDEDVRAKAWQSRALSAVWESQPTPAHRAIAELAQRGAVRCVITQNTDGLHQLAGTPDDLVEELHGTMRYWRCEFCRAAGDMDEMIARVRTGETDPRCPYCGGIVRAQTILFEEALDADVLNAAAEAAQDCDVFVAVGTSLFVTPAADLFPLAIESGARGIIVNAEPTPFDGIADRVERRDIQDVLPELIADL